MANSKEMNVDIGVMIESGSNSNLTRLGYSYSSFLGKLWSGLRH